MPTHPNWTRYLFVLCVSLILLFPPSSVRADKRSEDRPNRYKLVMVIDVSPSLRAHKKVIDHIVAMVYDSIFRPQQDDLHIITFSNKAQILETTRHKSAVVKTIAAQLLQRGERTLPARGLRKVFDLIDGNFPDKIGIILFISDGEDSEGQRNHQETQRVIGSLQNSGFTIFNIFVATHTRYSDRSFMSQMAQWSHTPLFEIAPPGHVQEVLNHLKKELSQTTYSSPIPYREYLDLKNQLKANFQKELGTVYRDMDAHLQHEVDAIKTKWSHNLNRAPATSGNSWTYILAILGIMGGLIVGGILFFLKTRRGTSQMDNYAISAAEPLWGELVHVNSRQRFDLSTIHSGETFYPKYKHQKFQFLLQFQNNQKVMQVRSPQAFQVIDDQQHILPAGCITEAARFIRCEDAKGGNDIYAYHFLDTLEDDLTQPACTKETFLGRQELIDQIKMNFLQSPQDISHYLIYGMANSGKTSLLHYLHQVILPESLRLKKRYYVYLIEFNQYKTTGVEALNAIIPENTAEKIVMIDEYDNFIQKYPNDFLNWINTLCQTQSVYFIFAGRKGVYDLTASQKNRLPNRLEETLLQGLDDISRLSAANSHSRQLINTMLTTIGFDSKFMDDAVKSKIAEYTNGIPYLIKKILLTVISDWLHKEAYYVIGLDDLEQAIPQMIGIEKFNSIIKSFNNDETNSVFFHNRSEAAIAKQILNLLATEGRGKLLKTSLFDMLTDANDPTAPPLAPTKLEHHLEQIKSMGFVIERNGVLYGSPQLFFYKGESII